MKSRCSHHFPLALLALSTAAFAGCSGDEVPPIKTPRPEVTLTDPAKVDSSYLADTGGTLLIKVGAGTHAVEIALLMSAG